MDQLASPAHVTAWRPPVAGIREVLHARFQAHAYPRHAHDTWTLFIVDAAAFQLVNPKAWIFALGAVTTFRLTGLDPLVGAIAVPLVMAAVIVPSASLWAGFGDVLGRLLTGEQSRRIVNGLMAALVLGTVVLVWV